MSTEPLRLRTHAAVGPSRAQAGYKRTALGVIPSDWQIIPLGQEATLITGPFGSTLHKSDYIQDGVPVINPMHIVDSRLAPSRTMTVPRRVADKLLDFALRSGDILMARRGDMGRCAVVQDSQAGWICGTGSLIVRCSGELEPEFLQLVLSSPRVVAAIEDGSVGSTMTSLNHGALKSLPIQHPPRPEQETIAAALLDAGDLVRTLDALIDKKRDMKQAIMQQLLTGKSRLPGFRGKWKTVRLLDLADVDPENLPSSTDPGYAFNYISLEHVDTGRLVGYSEEVFRTAPSRARRVLRPDDVLMSTVRPNLMAHLHYREQVKNAVCSTGFAVLRAKRGLAAPGFLFAQLFANSVRGQIERTLVCSTGFAVLRAKRGLAAPGFLFAQLFANSVRGQIERTLAGSNYPAINSRDVGLLEIPCPPNLDEQQAISTVLSDLDAEIAALERRRDKTRAIKQGMMQALLTGRVRLAPAAPTAAAAPGAGP